MCRIHPPTTHTHNRRFVSGDVFFGFFRVPAHPYGRFVRKSDILIPEPSCSPVVRQIRETPCFITCADFVQSTKGANRPRALVYYNTAGNSDVFAANPYGRGFTLKPRHDREAFEMFEANSATKFVDPNCSKHILPPPPPIILHRRKRVRFRS